ncbi:hypothetical protein TNCV_3089841 [Trichonephila clavipes]|nr:hypothetical protein TNCV_3089841 [Trichonephila clavipes]
MPPVWRSQIEAHENHRVKGLEVRLSLALNIRQVTARISSAKFSEESDRWRHHRSPPPQFSQGTEMEGNILQSSASVIQPTRLQAHSDFRARTRVYSEGTFHFNCSLPEMILPLSIVRKWHLDYHNYET